MFSRTTHMQIIEALQLQTHAEMEKFALEFGLEDVISGKYKKEKEVSIMKHLIGK